MKYMITIVFMIFAIVVVKAENRVSELRIISYNIRNGNGMAGDNDLQRTARVLTAQSPDIVALQEIDSITGRSGGRHISAELAKLTSMNYTYAPAIAYDGGGYGIALLSKEKPIDIRRISLPGRDEERVLIIAEFKDYVFCATHFSLTPEDQLTSIDLIEGYVKEYSKPLFFAGDLNFEPSSDQYKKLIRNFTILTDVSKASYPADSPTDCIDYIAVYSGKDNFATTIKTGVVNAPIESDHRPVIADVRYGKIVRTNPYLQNPTNGGITVLWQTNTPSHSWVEWGTDTSSMQRAQTLIAGQVICNNYLNKIRLENIQGGQKYYYRIVSREITSYGAYGKSFGGEYRSQVYEFKLPKITDTDFKALVFNDLHQKFATMDALKKVIEAKDYNFVIFNGDCVDDPSSESQAISAISYFNDAVNASEKPVLFIRGNHEIRGAFSMGFTTLFDYAGGQSYGAMNWGDTRFVILDCGEDKPDDTPVYYGLNDFKGFREDQLKFIQKEHSSSEFKKAKKRILIHHMPLWGLEEEYNPCLALWGKELNGKSYNVAINGHTHQSALHLPGSEWGNNFPVIIGGGYDQSSATVMLVNKAGEKLSVDCYNMQGDLLFNKEL